MAFAGVTGIAGYGAGNFYPAPPEIIQAVNKEAAGIHARMELANVDFAGLRSLMPKGKFEEMQTDMNNMAIASGEVIQVEQDSGTVEEQLDNLALETPTPAAPAPAPATPAPATAGAKSNRCVDSSVGPIEGNLRPHHFAKATVRGEIGTPRPGHGGDDQHSATADAGRVGTMEMRKVR